MAQDKKITSSLLYWLPRIVAILLIGFLSVFALDVFGVGGSLPQQIIGFLIHLVPNFLLLGTLIVAWKKEELGGVLFLLFGFASIIFFHTYKDFVSFLILSLPIIIIGVLFLFSHNMTKRTILNKKG